MIDTIPDNFIYFSLSIINKDTLLKVTKGCSPNFINNNTKLYLDHITLLHKNEKCSDLTKIRMYNLLNYMFENFIGQTYEIKITHYGFNTNAYAFKVELCDAIPRFTNKVYHITIATYNNAKPVESNYIRNWIKLKCPIVISTILTKVIIDENI